MIQLTCANCKASLEVDDAFAGGVCRCQHCGTIQTVPKPGARPRVPGAPVPHPVGGGNAGGGDEPRALYQVKSRTGLSSAPSGLEELAEVVHSSGLSGSGLSNRSSRQIASYVPASASAKPNKNMFVFGAIGGSVVLVILAVIAFFVFNSKVPKPGDAVPQTGTTVVDAKPNFAGIELTGTKVAYVIDRGDATSGYFDDLKVITTRSVRSIGPERRFQAVLWNNGSDDAYPRAGLGYGTPEDEKRLNAWFDDVSTGRATTVDSALKSALAQSPDEIVLITGKSDQLDEDFVKDVMKIRGSKPVKIHGITLGTSPSADPLRKIALETGGKFLNLKREQIDELVH